MLSQDTPYHYKVRLQIDLTDDFNSFPDPDHSYLWTCKLMFYLKEERLVYCGLSMRSKAVHLQFTYSSLLTILA